MKELDPYLSRPRPRPRPSVVQRSSAPTWRSSVPTWCSSEEFDADLVEFRGVWLGKTEVLINSIRDGRG